MLDAPLPDDAVELIGEPSDAAIAAIVALLIEAVEREENETRQETQTHEMR